jgi:prepilin-type N-terminal cleavage/methylation domain-containing protein
MSTPFRRGFTLIELMIVVAIIGILASLGVQEFSTLLLRTKRAELSTHLDAIRSAEHAYLAEWDVYTTCALTPPDVPGRKAVLFGVTETSSADWNLLGWVPDGRVYGQYEASATGVGDVSIFETNAYADVDGDGNLCHYRATHLLKAELMTPNTIY